MHNATHEFTNGLEANLPRLRRYARRLARNPSDADDLVQDCLERALAKSHQFQAGTNLGGWLFMIIRNLHFNELRRGAHRPVSLDQLAGFEPATSAGQESAVELSDFARAFAKLAPAKQETVMLIGCDGLSYEEAAKKLGIPVGTVRSRLSRTREELRELLDGSAAALQAGAGSATRQ